MSKNYKAAILVEHDLAHSIFQSKDLDFLASFAEFNPISQLPAKITPEFMTDMLKGAQACISSWRTPAFTDEIIEKATELKLIAHSAGAVRHMVTPNFWKSGCRITSNAKIIAEDVAQTTLALILTSLKQLWRFNSITSSGGWGGGEMNQFTTKRLDGLNLGIVGASNVGHEVINILKPFKCNINIYDPYLSSIEAEMLGVKLMPLDELIQTSDVLSLHAPANKDCRHMLNAGNIPMIKDGALLINMARGMLIDEAALIKELKTGRFTACLDVTDPEPPASDHLFRTMENVILTPHIAGGSTMNGRQMLGRNSIKEIYNFLIKGLIEYEVREEMLEHMA